MTYILFATLGFISLLIILGAIRQKSWENDGRILNADWLDNDTKFHLISRWGAQY